MSRHRPALHRWLDFLGVSRRRADLIHASSLRLLDDFDRFLGDANGLSVHTRIYIEDTRPASASDQLFLRVHPPFDRPLGTEIVRYAVRRAYARCGFPLSWTGSPVATYNYVEADLKMKADCIATVCRRNQTDWAVHLYSE